MLTSGTQHHCRIAANPNARQKTAKAQLLLHTLSLTLLSTGGCHGAEPGQQSRRGLEALAGPTAHQQPLPSLCVCPFLQAAAMELSQGSDAEEEAEERWLAAQPWRRFPEPHPLDVEE